MFNLKKIVIIIFAICINLSFINAGKILCLMSVDSHRNQDWNNALLQQLVEKGHELTIVSAVEGFENTSKHSVRHIHLKSNQEVPAKDLKHSNAFMNMLYWYEHQMSACKAIIDSKGLEQAIKVVRNEKFDLILYDAGHGAGCLLNLVTLKSKAPIVGVSDYKILPEHFELSGSGDINIATVPYFTTRYGENMSYWQRVYNSILYSAAYFFRHYVFNPVIQGMMTKAGMPSFSINQHQENFKLILVNTHSSFDVAQPLPANMIEVGGLHLKTAQDLSKDILEFIQESKVVYITLDSRMGQEQFDKILQVIQHFPKIKFLWKLDANLLGNTKLPSNVYLAKDLNTNNVLAHSSTKVYINNADRLSLQESIHQAVPVVTIPLVFDQLSNAQSARTKGLGINIDFDSFAVSSLQEALTVILSNDSYRKTAKYLQKAFQTQAQNPLAKATWYVEQLLEDSQSLNYLTSKSFNNLMYAARHSWDVLILVFILIAAFITNIVILTRQTFKSIRKSNKKLKSEKLSNESPKKEKSSKKSKAKKKSE